MKISYAEKETDSLEQAKIVSIDKISGRVGISLRNGLISSATYLYDINDLRVGMSVLVVRVSNTYVILNKISNMPRTGVSHSLPRPVVPYVPPTFTWSHPFSNSPDGPLSRLGNKFFSCPSGPPYIKSGEVVLSSGNYGFGASCLAILGDYFSLFIKIRIFNPPPPEGSFDLKLDKYPYDGSNRITLYITHFEPKVHWMGPWIGPPNFFHYVSASIPRDDIWLKITKTGSNVQGLYSLDGVNWIFLGSDTVWTGQSIVSFYNNTYALVGGVPTDGLALSDFVFISGEPTEFPKAESIYLFCGQSD